MKYLIIALVVWNIITFLMMGIDKHKAEKDKWRIKEKTLLLSAFLMGGTGILSGALVFHHKTRKTKFIIGMPLAFAFNIALIALFIAKVLPAIS